MRHLPCDCKIVYRYPDDLAIKYCPKHKAAPELYEECKKLIMHKHQGNLHPVDYQRIEQALAKAEGKETS